MITLTAIQAFFADYLNLIEIIGIYRLITSKLITSKLFIDFLVTLIIIILPVPFFSIYLILLVSYLFLDDRLSNNSYIIPNTIIAMILTMVMSLVFDLSDYFTNRIFVIYKEISGIHWLVLVNPFLITIIIGIIIFCTKPRIQLFEFEFQKSIRLWKQVAAFFIVYIILAIITEETNLANKTVSLFLLLYLTVLLVGLSGFARYARDFTELQHQQQLINSYRNQIETAQKINAQYEDLRRERHDMKNMLLSVQGYIRDHNDEKANQLLSAFLQTNIDSKNYEEIDNSLSRLNISGLRNLIKEKAYRIVEQEIPLAIEVNAKIDSLPGSEVKTARTIGILLDNAIEATSNQKRPYIQIALLRHDEENYELVVANSLEKTLDLNKAMKFEHSEKENHQGIGLSNITQLVDNDDRYSFSAEVKEKVIIMTCFIQGK